MPYLPRALAATVQRACKTFPAVLVTGARQAGKTTLLQHEFGESHRFVSLERPDIRARALADPIGFLAEVPAPVILDEIQYLPELLHYIKDRIDADRRPGQWLLSGSQNFALMSGVSQTLAGRVAALHLDPLSVREAVGLPVSRIDDLLARTFDPTSTVREAPAAVDVGDWLLRGGYPEPRVSAGVDRQLWFSSYIQTYLERDVRDILQVGDLNTFSRFLGLVAARTGTILSLADLGRDVGVAAPTVRRWISVLEASGVVYLLRPYYRNFGKRITKSPKLIFLDAALATFLMRVHDREAILAGASTGALVETAAIAEWVKVFRQNGEEPALYFWRAAGIDIDLVIERNRRLYAVEVKATATPVPRQAEGLMRWLDLAGESAHGVLACRVERPTALLRTIRAVPWHLAW